MKSKKGLGVVIATSLFLVVAIVATIGFQMWFNTYSSQNQVKTELQSDLVNALKFQGLVNNRLYVYSNSNSNFTSLKIKDSNGAEICNFRDSIGIGLSNLVGSWNFDEGSGNKSYDSSLNNFTGNITKSTLWSQDSIRGTSLKMSGSTSAEYVILGNNSAFNPETFTITAWIKVELNWSWNYIISNTRNCCGTYNGIELRAREYVGSGQLLGTVWNQTADSPSNNGVPNNEWVFVAFTFNTTHYNLYNGLNDVTTTASTISRSGTPASFTTNLGAMGYYPESLSLKGNLDEVRLYNTSLNSTQIEQIHWDSIKRINSGLNKIYLSECNITEGETYEVVAFTPTSSIQQKVVAK